MCYLLATLGLPGHAASGTALVLSGSALANANSEQNWELHTVAAFSQRSEPPHFVFSAATPPQHVVDNEVWGSSAYPLLRRDVSVSVR